MSRSTPRVTLDGDRVAACPECDDGPVYERTGRGNAVVGDSDDRYVCYECTTSFDEYVARAPREHSPSARREMGASSLGELGQRALAADPDEVFSE